MNIAEELKGLAELKESGVLTQEEFDQQKAKLLSQNAAPQAAAPAAGNSPAQAASGTNEALGYILLGLPALGIALIWLWVGNMTVFDDPGTALGTISLIVVLGTAIVAAIEASNMNMGKAEDVKPNGKKREGPIAWFFSLWFLWFVTYPMYMNRRAVYGLKKHLVPGIIISVLLTGSYFFMIFAIDEQKKKVHAYNQYNNTSYDSGSRYRY